MLHVVVTDTVDPLVVLGRDCQDSRKEVRLIAREPLELGPVERCSRYDGKEGMEELLVTGERLACLTHTWKGIVVRLEELVHQLRAYQTVLNRSVIPRIDYGLQRFRPGVWWSPLGLT